MSFVDLSGTVGGVGTLTGALTQTYLMGAQVRGLGSLLDDWAVSLSGTLLGTSSLTGEALRVYYLTGHVQGYGKLVDSVPLPLQGYGVLSSYLEVFSPPPTVLSGRYSKSVPVWGIASAIRPNVLCRHRTRYLRDI